MVWPNRTISVSDWIFICQPSVEPGYNQIYDYIKEVSIHHVLYSYDSSIAQFILSCT